MWRALAILWLISLSSCAALDDQQLVEDPVFTPQLTGALQNALENSKRILNSENISASLYISDRCYWEGAAGVTKQDSKVPVKADMLFNFASITKTFTAAIVLQLVEEGKLNLEDPLGRWLPPHPHIESNITIRQLLDHGSGLDDFFGDDRYWSEIDADPNRVWKPQEMLNLIGPPPFTGFAPPKYSNTNYILLGMIIEAATRNSLEHELQARITSPLQLNTTYLPKRDFTPGRWADNTFLSNSLYSSVWAAGAIASTSKDIAKWSQVLYSGNFLQPTSLKSMLTTEPRRIGQGGFRMGLGVWEIKVDGSPAWGHGGSLYPFLSQTFYLPEQRLSVAYSFNWSDTGAQPLPGRHLVRAYLENQPDNITMCFDT